MVGLWVLFTAFGLVILGIKGLKLPSYSGPSGIEVPISNKDQDYNEPPKFSKWRINALLWLMCLFISVVTTLDMTFQSKIFTFGLCGPLKMSLSRAGWLNTVFFVNYLVGRLVSIPLSTMVSPAKIILGSSLICFGASVLLVIFGNSSTIAMFIGKSKIRNEGLKY